MEASYYQYRFVQRVDDVYAENSFLKYKLLWRVRLNISLNGLGFIVE